MISSSDLFQTQYLGSDRSVLPHKCCGAYRGGNPEFLLRCVVPVRLSHKEERVIQMPLLDSPLSVKSGFSLCHCFQCIIFFVVTTDLPSILATFYFIKSLKAEKDPATPSRAYIHIENMLFILGYSFRMCPYLMTSINEEAMETIDKIKQQIAENPILLYMKGSPKLPSCGFSSQAAQALMACGEKFAYVDILQTQTSVQSCRFTRSGQRFHNCGLKVS